MKNKHQGFGKAPDYKSIEQGLEKLSSHAEGEIAKLERILSTPAGQGEIDAFLGREPRSDNPKYKAAYDKAHLSKLLADPEELANLKAMQPFVEQVLDEFIK